MKKNILSVIVVFLALPISSQSWELTATAPEGGGVTELIYHNSSEYLFASTGSFDWPNGQDGGIRRSSDGGDTWENVFDAYTGRFILDAPDGNLYASVWPYPDEEGLYRSSDNGNTWDLLTSVPSGNNIFAIAVDISGKETVIYAGTGLGILRSMDNGNTWSYSNTGINPNTLVRDVAVSPSGIVASGTTTGLYISQDKGDSWQISDGIENETITELMFASVADEKEKDVSTLYAGSASGKMFATDEFSSYLLCTVFYVFIGGGEFGEIAVSHLLSENKKLRGVAFYPNGPSDEGGVKVKTDDEAEWTTLDEGLPLMPPTSSLAEHVTERKATSQVTLWTGLYENINGGAKIYKTVLTNFLGTDPAKHSLTGATLTITPNPASDKIILQITTLNKGQMSVKLFDASGRMINTLFDGRVTKGNYEIFCPSVLDSGLYFVECSVDRSRKVEKLVIR